MSIRMTVEELENLEKEAEIDCFKVVYDGTSRPMIETPTGRLLSISEFQDGRWVSGEREINDCETIVNSLNWILAHGPDLINEGVL